MDISKLSKTQKLTISAMVIALYVVVMYFTQEFAFGAYQIRIATAFYSLSYLFPFLVLPLGISNFLSNLLGGLGLIDMVGGCLVGMLTSYLIVLIKRKKWNPFLTIIPIILIPGLGVSTWLSYLLKMPYAPLAISLCIGQIIPAVCGALLIQTLKRVFVMPVSAVNTDNQTN
ncbi:MAG: QueT transporter family protein [Lachnospiraceae bacterium]|nr:QueT transporter family protein [Lachnospiraceae bacterium]